MWWKRNTALSCSLKIVILQIKRWNTFGTSIRFNLSNWGKVRLLDFDIKIVYLDVSFQQSLRHQCYLPIVSRQSRRTEYTGSRGKTSNVRIKFYSDYSAANLPIDPERGNFKPNLNSFDSKVSTLTGWYGWRKISNPFYLFQFYTIVVWMAQSYFDYSAMVIAATMAAVGSSVYETRKVIPLTTLL